MNGGNDLVGEGLVGSRHGSLIVAIAGGPLGGLAQASGQGRIAEEAFDGVGDGADVAGLDEQAGLLMSDQFADPDGAGGDDGPTGSHRLQDRQPERFRAGGVTHDLRSPKRVAHRVTVAVAGECHQLGDAEFGREGLELPSHGPIPEQIAGNMPPAVAKGRDGAEQRGVVLVLIERGGHDQPGRAARRCRRRGRCPVVRVDAVWNDRQRPTCVGQCGTAIDEFGHALGDGDGSVGLFAEDQTRLATTPGRDLATGPVLHGDHRRGPVDLKAPQHGERSRAVEDGARRLHGQHRLGDLAVGRWETGLVNVFPLASQPVESLSVVFPRRADAVENVRVARGALGAGGDVDRHPGRAARAGVAEVHNSVIHDQKVAAERGIGKRISRPVGRMPRVSATMDMVLFSFNEFHGRIGRAHHLARHLAERHRVFFVNPPESFIHRPFAPRRLEVVSENLMTINLPGGLPGRRTWAIHQLNQSRWLGMLRGLLHQSGWGRRGRRVCVHTVPVWERAQAVLKPDLTVYDAHDDWRSIPPNCPAMIDRLESSYAQDADVILSASERTAERFAALKRRTHELPNACDFEHFASAASSPPARDMAKIPHPRVMYVGGLERCLNQQIVAQVAEAMPNTSFVFVGPVITSQKALRGMPNVHILGERSYEALPSYLAGAAVCWIPFELTDHALGRDCVKLYEYLATGLPVVTTPLPRAAEFAEHVVIAETTAASLTKACQEALADRSDERRRGRLAVAGAHTWGKRAEQLAQLMAEALRGPVVEAASVEPARCVDLPEIPPLLKGREGWPWTVEDAPHGQAAEDHLPTITLVTPTLNQAEYLEETLRSVLAQGYPHLEYIVMDGGSTDGTLDILDRYRPLLSACVSEGDQGQSDAINRGLALGGGEICGWLCSDDTLTPGALRTVGEYFAGRAECQWLAGAGEFIDLESGGGGRLAAELDGEMALLDYWRYGMPGHYVPQPSCFWRRDLWDAVGGVRVDNHLTMDYELWLEFRSRTTLHTIDRPLSVSKLHPGAKSRRFRRQQYADMRRRAFRAARRAGVPAWRLGARKLFWTVFWRLCAVKHRLFGS